MAKGLLRKALHGAAKSSSEILGAKIEDMRQKRLMDYEAGQRMAEAQQQNTWTTERDERLAGQQATQAELAHQRAIQRDVFGAGMQTNLDRETESIAQANRLALEGTRSAADIELENVRSRNDMTRVEKEHELRLEQAKAEAASKGIELKSIKVVQYDDQGAPVEVEMSGYVDPQTLEVWFVDPDTNKLTTTRQQQAETREQAWLGKSAETGLAVRDDDRTDSQIRESARGWFSGSPDQLPLEEHLAAMGEKRSIFEQEIERLRTGETGAPARASTPTAAPTPPTFSVGQTQVEVEPSLLSRAQGAISDTAQTLSERTQRERNDFAAEQLLPRLEAAANGAVRLPQITMLNRAVYTRALESDRLTPEQKAIIQAMLDRDAGR
jgi:hypothetical protein